MDIIYHRNCLDGVFSAHLFYLMSRVLTQQSIDSFLMDFEKKIQSKKSYQEIIEKTKQFQNIIDLTNQVLSNLSESQNKILEESIQKQLQSKIHPINQDFFHQPNIGVSYYAYSMFAGEFFNLKFPSKSKILLILDTNLVNADNIHTISERYDVVVVIDHHTSFQPIKKDILIDKHKFKKLFYVFSENHCATELCFHFLQKYLSFQNYFEPKHVKDLKQMISYISANDRKHNQTKQSKAFVLGFYYFGLQLSHFNPLLNKRIGMLNLQYLMEKGENLYKAHIKEIANEVASAMICRLETSGKLKGAKTYLVKPSNPAKISDIGVVLAYLSKTHDMENLAILFMQNSDQIRISTRSHRALQNPLALQLAQKYQGGGHLCAAGFKISIQKFKSQFTKIPCQKGRLQITPQQVQKILLNQDLLIK